MNNLSSPYSSTRWSSGSPISTPVWLINQVLSKPSATPSSQLPTEDTLKKFIYPHYLLDESTPVLAVRAEFGSYSTFVAGISRLAKYMSYITQEAAPPLVRKAVLTQRLSPQKPNLTGGLIHGASYAISKSRNLIHPTPPPAASKTRSNHNTNAGG